MATLEIRLLGGFAVRRGERRLAKFESQKARALLAYLACHPDQPTARAHLASLLWPEEDPAHARQNLRQAVYNLRQGLGARGNGGPDFILSSHQTVQLNPDADIWLDVQMFEQTARHGLKSSLSVDLGNLSKACSVYRGHLLPGFSVKGSEEYEDWLWEKREQLRELAGRSLRVLIGCHLDRSEYDVGIDHARNLVELDPLSEEAHRTLIHLYFLAGRRSQALIQYKAFAERLKNELDLAPLSETTALYESILSDAAPGPLTATQSDSIGPFVTLEGRDREMKRLLGQWHEVVVEGESRFIVVDGESGIGKSRLVKTFLHQATSGTRGTVLRGRAFALAAPRVYGSLIDIVRNAWRVGQAEDRHRFHKLQLSQLALVRELLPELAELDILETIDPILDVTDRKELYSAVTEFLLAAAGGQAGAAPNPVVLFFDDVQWADPGSIDYLVYLLSHQRDYPLLVIATCRPDQVGPEQIDSLVTIRRADQTLDLTLERVGPGAVKRMIRSLAEEKDRASLTRFLNDRSQGLPLLIAETVNYLCSLGHLTPGRTNRWRLANKLKAIADTVPESIEGLVWKRVQNLPSSTRRLLAHASLIGQRFDFQLLCRAADEHTLVVETAIGLMLEHWLARQFPEAWASTHRERDIVLWAQGARRGTFEFTHKTIRGTVYGDLPEDRRALLHRSVAEALEMTHADHLEEYCEELAYHYLRAQAWPEAAVYLRRSAERAARLLADQSAHSYCSDALEIAGRLEAISKTKKDRTHWRRFSAAVDKLRNTVAARLGPEALSRYPSLTILMD